MSIENKSTDLTKWDSTQTNWEDYLGKRILFTVKGGAWIEAVVEELSVNKIAIKMRVDCDSHEELRWFKPETLQLVDVLPSDYDEDDTVETPEEETL